MSCESACSTIRAREATFAATGRYSLKDIGDSMRLPPKVDLAAMRAESAATAATQSATMEKLLEVIGAAVNREETRSAPNLPDALKFTNPVVITLKPGDRSLRGLMPVDAAERGALNTLIKDLPIQLACQRERVTETVRQSLEAQTPAGMNLIEVAFDQQPRKPLRLSVQRIHDNVMDAFNEEVVEMIEASRKRYADEQPKTFNLEKLGLGHDDTVIYGLLRLARAYNWTEDRAWKNRVGLSTEQVAVLLKNDSITTDKSAKEMTADIMRYVIDQNEPRSWAEYVPVSGNELYNIAMHFVRDSGVATPKELARGITYPIPAIFEGPLAKLSAADQKRAMSAIVARVRSDYDHSDEVFELHHGISRQDATRMIDGKLDYSPVPMVELVGKLLNVRRLQDTSSWWKYCNVDDAELVDLRAKFSASKTSAEEPERKLSHTLRTDDLLATVPRAHRAVLGECITAVTQNKFLSDEKAFAAVFKVAKKDFQAMLSGRGLASPVSARELSESVLSFVYHTDKVYFSDLMSFSRSDVRDALEALRAA